MIRDGIKVSMDRFYPIRADFFPMRGGLKAVLTSWAEREGRQSSSPLRQQPVSRGL
jgi:hypothetical protein